MPAVLLPSSQTRRFVGAATIALALAACGGTPPPPKPDPSAGRDKPAASAAPAAAPEEPKVEFPTACSKEGGDLCVPPASFVKHLCAAGLPEMALALFAKGTPQVRGYLARATEAWDASGGSSGSAKLEFDEEVLILVRRAPATGGMVLNGGSGGSYEVLRWDGKCASLTAEEVRTRVPPEPGHADIPWRRLNDDVQEALLKEEKIATLAADQKKECKGVSAGQTSPPKCEKAQKKLSRAIVAYVRRGGALPPPPQLP